MRPLGVNSRMTGTETSDVSNEVTSEIRSLGKSLSTDLTLLEEFFTDWKTSVNLNFVLRL